MRVAVITTSYPCHPDDAAGHFVRSEARALLRAGADVLVFAPAPVGPRLVPIEDPAVHWVAAGDAFGAPGVLQRLRVKPTRATQVLGFLWHTRRALRQLGPFDRVVAHWLLPAGWPLASAAGAPSEIVVHGSDMTLLEALPPYVSRAILLRVLRQNTTFRCVSRDLYERLARCARLDLAARSYVQPCAIDVHGVPTREAARQRLGVAPEAQLVVLVARLIQTKRCEVGLAASALLPDTHVVVVGDGPERAALSARFPEVRFVGEVPRSVALSWIAAADVVVSSSLHEGAPTVVREARALGVSVVASAAGDLVAWAKSDPELHVVRGPREPDSERR